MQQCLWKPRFYSNSYVKLFIFFTFEELLWKKYVGSNPKILREYLKKQSV